MGTGGDGEHIPALRGQDSAKLFGLCIPCIHKEEDDKEKGRTEKRLRLWPEMKELVSSGCLSSSDLGKKTARVQNTYNLSSQIIEYKTRILVYPLLSISILTPI